MTTHKILCCPISFHFVVNPLKPPQQDAQLWNCRLIGNACLPSYCSMTRGHKTSTWTAACLFLNFNILFIKDF